MVNLFEPELVLSTKIQDIGILSSMIFLDEAFHEVKKDIFRDKVGDDRIAAVFQYDGFDIADSMGNVAKNRSGNSNQLLEVKYRAMIVAPVVDKNTAGTKFVEMLNLFLGFRIKPTYQPMRLIKDVQEFNSARFGDSLIAIPALYSFKTAIK